MQEGSPGPMTWKPFVSLLLVGMLLAGTLGSVQVPVTSAQVSARAAVATKTFSDATLGLSLRYPSAWAVVTHVKTAGIFGKEGAQFSLTSTVLYSHDNAA